MDSSMLQWQAIKITELTRECQRLYDENLKLYEKVKQLSDEVQAKKSSKVFSVFETDTTIVAVETTGFYSRYKVQELLKNYGYHDEMDFDVYFATDIKDAIRQYIAAKLPE